MLNQSCHKPTPTVCFLCLFAILLVAGCGSSRQAQLEEVAKDWCLTIRASQVIPVYPLTEDLEPGDVFLVTVSAQDQVEQYNGKGFLPLDQHVTHLVGLPISDRYLNRYGTVDGSVYPHVWQFPTQLPEGQKHGWTRAPGAAFPTYSFSVKRGFGFQLAIPVEGVPVGLSLMGTDSATGSIAIAEASTYGVELDDIEPRIQAWATNPDRKQELAQLRKSAGRAIFLRVVARVYLTARVNISLTNSMAFGAGASVGQAPPTFSTPLDGKDAAENFKQTAEVTSQALKSLNDLLKQSTQFGGSLQVTLATTRNVSMNESFRRPLVIGYLGFDFPVFEDGSLGTPVATQNQLNGINQPTVPASRFTPIETSMEMLLNDLLNEEKDVQQKVCDAAALELGGKFSEEYKKPSGENPDLPTHQFRAAVSRLLGDKSIYRRAYDALSRAYARR